MRILHVVNHVRDVGNGIVNALVDVALSQASAGHTVAVASEGGAFEGLLAGNGVKRFALSLERSPLGMCLAALRLRSISEYYQPDVVHVHGLSGVILGRIIRCNLRYRLVATAHRVYDRRLYLLALADRVIAVSGANAKALERAGIPRRKIHIVNNGTVGTMRRPTGAFEAADLQHPAIVTVAGLTKRKGIDVLIKAFEQVALRFPAAHLYVIGDGPERSLFERAASGSAFSDRIVFAGFTPTPEQYLCASDVFVLTSRRESFPLVLIEAREMCCAIVATDVDGVSEALDFGRAGILVRSEDISGIAAAIERLLTDSDLARRYRKAAGVSLEAFTVERMCSETIDAYGG